MFTATKQLLKDAIRAVPAVKYALGVSGIMAALALGTALFKSPQAALLGAIPMLGLMVLLLVFAAGTRLPGVAMRMPALFFMWAVLGLFVASATLTVSSVFFQFPKPFPDLMIELMGGKKSDRTLDDEIKLAEQMLVSFQDRDFKRFYEYFPPDLRSAIAYPAFAAEGARQHFQFTGPPLYRRFEAHREAGGFLTISFIAEFDSVSVFREMITFARRGDEWKPWRFDIWPSEWPLASTSQIVHEPNAGDVLKNVANVSDGELLDVVRTRYGNWYVQSGWRVSVESVGQKRSDRTCDVWSKEEQTGAVVLLRATLGGCGWQKGQALGVYARINDVFRDRVELDAVRVLN